MYTKESLQDHLHNEHKQNPLSEYLREIVYGGIDGIVTTFAVVAGFSGASMMSGTQATLTFTTVLLFGFANLFADGVSMGLGNFLSILTEKDVYKQHKDKERKEIVENHQMEFDETKLILEEKGFSVEEANQLATIYQRHPEYWVDWMMNNELEMPNPENTNPYLTALSTIGSFLFFGFIPLAPYFLITLIGSQHPFMLSIIGTGSALFLLGVVKGKVIGGGMLRSIIEVIGIGSVAAALAFFVGTFFNI